MRFLHELRVGARNPDDGVRDAADRSAARARQRDRFNAVLPGVFRGSQDIRRVPARADADERVPGAPQCLHLTLEDSIKAEIVGICRNKGSIRRERDRRQTGARKILAENARKLCRDVLTVGGAPAVAAQENLSAAAQCLDENLRAPGDLSRAFFGDLFFERRAPQQVLARRLLHRFEYVRHRASVFSKRFFITFAASKRSAAM